MTFSGILLCMQHRALKAKKFIAFKASSLYLSITSTIVTSSTAVFHLLELVKYNLIRKIKINLISQSQNIIQFLISVCNSSKTHWSCKGIFWYADAILNIVHLHSRVPFCNCTDNKHHRFFSRKFSYQFWHWNQSSFDLHSNFDGIRRKMLLDWAFNDLQQGLAALLRPNRQSLQELRE